jgi:hypothetical protein
MCVQRKPRIFCEPSFGPPNEIFLTKDGKAFTGPGIPRHVKVPVFPKEILEKGRDGSLEKALEILR